MSQWRIITSSLLFNSLFIELINSLLIIVNPPLSFRELRAEMLSNYFWPHIFAFLKFFSLFFLSVSYFAPVQSFTIYDGFLGDN